MGEGTPPRRDGRTTDTRARIEATALELFTTRGFAATSLRDIAAALDVTKAAVYYHFPAKADLARSLFQPFIDDVDALLLSIEGRDLTARQVLEACFDTLYPHRRAFAALQRDASVLAHVDLEARARDWIDRIPQLLAGGEPDAEGRIRAIVAFGGLVRALLVPELPAAQVRLVGVDAALAALGPAGSPR